MTDVSGARDHRKAVGPPGWYDQNSALQFELLFRLGLREHHRVLDIGCGSLRAGRLLIAYLLPEMYHGLEPDRGLVELGIAREVSEGLVELKRPRFVYRDDFGFGEFGQTFDFALAQSILSHTHEKESRLLLTNLAAGLAPGGVFVATFFRRTAREHRERQRGAGSSGWTAAGGVTYSWAEMKQMLGGAGLAGKLLGWPHLRQTWFVAVSDSNRGRLGQVARRTRSWRTLRTELR